MKTVIQALIDEIHYPLPYGKVENITIGRGIDGLQPFSAAIAADDAYKGALADCLYSLLQAITFSEADKSFGTLTDAQRKTILSMANKLYAELGEDEKELGIEPKVYIEN